MARPSLLDRLASRILEVPGVEEHPSQFGAGTAFWVDGREFLHFHGRAVEVRLTRKAIAAERARLRADPRVDLRSTDWIVVRLSSARDLSLALELARMAAEANRHKPGEPPRPVPDDRELARRRRTHGARTRDLDR